MTARVTPSSSVRAALSGQHCLDRRLQGLGESPYPPSPDTHARTSPLDEPQDPRLVRVAGCRPAADAAPSTPALLTLPRPWKRADVSGRVLEGQGPSETSTWIQPVRVSRVMIRGRGTGIFLDPRIDFIEPSPSDSPKKIHRASCQTQRS
jgi:hypothetical protein